MGGRGARQQQQPGLPGYGGEYDPNYGLNYYGGAYDPYQSPCRHLLLFLYFIHDTHTILF
jgi:hypothetical protein